MPVAIKIKRFTTLGDVPNTSELVDGEIAVNIADKKIYVRDGSTIVEMTADLSAVAEDILPDGDGTRNLGSATKRWAELFLTGQTINLGGATRFFMLMHFLLTDFAYFVSLYLCLFFLYLHPKPLLVLLFFRHLCLCLSSVKLTDTYRIYPQDIMISISCGFILWVTFHTGYVLYRISDTYMFSTGYIHRIDVFTHRI